MMDLTLMPKNDVVDDLTSTATDKPLSAAQGKVLNEKGGGSSEPIDITSLDLVTFNTLFTVNSCKVFISEGGWRVSIHALITANRIITKTFGAFNSKLLPMAFSEDAYTPVGTVISSSKVFALGLYGSTVQDLDLIDWSSVTTKAQYAVQCSWILGTKYTE